MKNSLIDIIGTIKRHYHRYEEIKTRMRIVAVIIPKYNNINLKITGFILIAIAFFLINAFPLRAENTNKIVNFEITLPEGVDPNALNLEFPKLKYNKKIVVSWINDDSYSIWNNIFCLVNKKWVDDGRMSFFDTSDTKTFFPHLNWSYNSNGTVYKRTTGYTPTKFLEYTDGTGIKHRFASTVATWYSKLGERDATIGIFAPWNSAKETRLMADFGFTVGYHDLSSKTTLITQEEFDSNLSTDSQQFLSLIDRIPQIMIEPNGNHTYIDYSQNNNIIQMILAQNGDPRIKTVYPFNAEFTLDKKELTVQRVFAYGTGTAYIDDMIARAQTQHDLGESTRTWIIGSAHRCTQETDGAFFCEIEKKFGATGDDSVWFPSIDEFFEYWYMKGNATIKKEIEGQKIRFILDIPVKDNFYFQNISVLINGISKIDGINVTSGDNVFGTSFGISDSKLLINLDFNESLPEKVEKYTSVYEKEKTIETYEDAMYFISQLKPELKKPYSNRINALLAPPVLSELKINNAIEKTGNNLVIVSFKASETAVYYRISESATFEDAEWLPLVNSPLFKLSPNLGNKTIYVQLKNALYESNIVSAQIGLIQSEQKVVVGFSGDSKTNKNEFVNGQMLNNVSFTLYNGWTAIQLYDTSNNPLMKLAKDPAKIKTAMDKYGITGREARGASYLNPLLSGDGGTYPDRFIKYSTFFGSNIEINPENRRLIAGFLEVPNGTYDIRILGSQNVTTTDFKNYRYQANDSEICIPESDIFNKNNSKFLEIKNVVVKDSTLLVCSWREPFGNKFGYYAPINLIEIKPSVSTSLNPMVTKLNKIKIYSGKGKLVIENKSLSPLSIYSIDGELLKQFNADQNLIEVLLPTGIYIVNGCKGIVF